MVMSIEPMPRQGAVGGSGTAGTTGSSMGEDKVYRVTLRMDDGTTRVVTQEKAPTYRTGDRVNMRDGVITR
jgi:outer membrane lipoprotein SlyB